MKKHYCFCILIVGIILLCLLPTSESFVPTPTDSDKSITSSKDVTSIFLDLKDGKLKFNSSTDKNIMVKIDDNVNISFKDKRTLYDYAIYAYGSGGNCKPTINQFKLNKNNKDINKVNKFSSDGKGNCWYLISSGITVKYKDKNLLCSVCPNGKQFELEISNPIIISGLTKSNTGYTDTYSRLFNTETNDEITKGTMNGTTICIDLLFVKPK